jgi:hypothetical protein
MPPDPVSQPILRLDQTLGSKKELAKIRDNLSAIVRLGEHLWLGGDEGTHLHRMTRDGSGNFGDHKRYDLASKLDLPVQGPKPPEIDIEGLDADGGYLWLIGSHSRKRKKAEDDKTPDDNRERLATIESDGNRYTLARIPLDSHQEPARKAGSLRAARLQGDEAGNLLTQILARDPHIGSFCTIPGKDNGLDVEGLAVRANRVFAGLRGPVLRGWAVILELDVRDAATGLLKFGAPLRKHFVELDGLGVRDLIIHDNDLYILAGPTMDLDGPVFVYQWPMALANNREALVPRKQLRPILEVPYGTGTDHAEGITFIDSVASEIMVCYDSPAPHRLVGDDGIRADVFSVAAVADD